MPRPRSKRWAGNARVHDRAIAGSPPAAGIDTAAQLAEFKPDLVFQIDHLRYEHGDLFPPELPFVCWIQDHLANLRTPEADRPIT